MDDKTEALLHILGAAAIMAVAALVVELGPDLGFWVAAGASTLVWWGREAIQDRSKQGVWRAPWAWSKQKLVEAIGPTLAAGGLAFWFSRIW